MDATIASPRLRWGLPAALALLFVALLPARRAALRGDDVATFEKHGLLELRDQGFVDYVWGGVTGAFEQGRLQALGGIQSEAVIWLLEDHPALYRVFLVALTVAAAYLLWRLARGLGLGDAGALLAVVLLVCAIQFRSYHDAMLGYYAATQCTLLLLLGSLLAFVRHLRGGGGLWLALALFVGACLIYEWAYALAGVYAGVALMQGRGLRAVRPALPFLAVGLLLAVGAFAARKLFAENVPAGYTVTLSVYLAARAYATQLFAPLPASGVIFEDNGFRFFTIGHNPTAAEWAGAAWRALAVAAAVVLLVPRALAARLGTVAVTGALLWVTPPVFLVVAPKYQSELSAAKGYLPALVQAFGVALVLAAAAIALVRAGRARSAAAARVALAAVAAVAGLAAGAVGFANLRVVAQEIPVVETRELLEEAAERGVFAGVPADASLVFSQRDMLWPTGPIDLTRDAFEAMLMDRTGRRYDARIVSPGQPFDCPPDGAFPPPHCAPLAERAALVRVRAYEAGGSVIALPVDGSKNERVLTERAGTIRVYSRTAQPPALVSELPGGGQWTSDAVAWRRVDGGAGWSLHEARLAAGGAPFANLVNDPRSKIDWTLPRAPDDMVRVYGARGVLP